MDSRVHSSASHIRAMFFVLKRTKFLLDGLLRINIMCNSAYIFNRELSVSKVCIFYKAFFLQSSSM